MQMPIMKIIFTLLFAAFFSSAESQLLTWSPQFIQESSSPIEITLDATKGNQGLKNYANTSDVYVHIGLITSYSSNQGDWKHVKYNDFNSPSPFVSTTYLGNNKWKYTITGGLRTFFGVTDANEKILKIAVLFRNGAGTIKNANADGSDMYVPVYDAALHVRIDEPFREPKFVPVPEAVDKTVGDNLRIEAKSSATATLKLYFNGVQVGATATNADTITAITTITGYGAQMIVAEAATISATTYDTIIFSVNAPATVAPLPAGVRDGINYWPGQDSVTLVLFAPHKTRVAVLGDFNNWIETEEAQLNRTPDSTRYWVTIKGLTPGTEYAYQFLIDGNLKVADYMAEKVLDPDNDQYIPAANYPN